jgi:hypothetical protein
MPRSENHENSDLVPIVKGLLFGLCVALLAIKVSAWFIPVAFIAWFVWRMRIEGRVLKAQREASAAEAAENAAYHAACRALVLNPNPTDAQLAQLHESGEWFHPECAARLAEVADIEARIAALQAKCKIPGYEYGTYEAWDRSEQIDDLIKKWEKLTGAASG